MFVVPIGYLVLIALVLALPGLRDLILDILGIVFGAPVLGAIKAGKYAYSKRDTVRNTIIGMFWLYVLLTLAVLVALYAGDPRWIAGACVAIGAYTFIVFSMVNGLKKLVRMRSASDLAMLTMAPIAIAMVALVAPQWLNGTFGGWVGGLALFGWILMILGAVLNTKTYVGPWAITIGCGLLLVAAVVQAAFPQDIRAAQAQEAKRQNEKGFNTIQTEVGAGGRLVKITKKQTKVFDLTVENAKITAPPRVISEDGTNPKYLLQDTKLWVWDSTTFTYEGIIYLKAKAVDGDDDPTGDAFYIRADSCPEIGTAATATPSTTSAAPPYFSIPSHRIHSASWAGGYGNDEAATGVPAHAWGAASGSFIYVQSFTAVPSGTTSTISARLSSELPRRTSTDPRYSSDIQLLVNGIACGTKRVIPDNMSGDNYVWDVPASAWKAGENQIEFRVSQNGGSLTNGLCIYGSISVQFR